MPHPVESSIFYPFHWTEIQTRPFPANCKDVDSFGTDRWARSRKRNHTMRALQTWRSVHKIRRSPNQTRTSHASVGRQASMNPPDRPNTTVNVFCSICKIPYQAPAGRTPKFWPTFFGVIGVERGQRKLCAARVWTSIWRIRGGAFSGRIDFAYVIVLRVNRISFCLIAFTYYKYAVNISRVLKQYLVRVACFINDAFLFNHFSGENSKRV